MTRVSWGRAFAFGAVAVGVPWAIVAAIAVFLLAMSGGEDGFARSVVIISPAIAAGAAVIAALITHRWQPLNRAGSGGHTVLACVLAIVVAAIVMAAVEPDSVLLYAPAMIMIGAGIFLLGGGLPWALAGGVLASGILRTRRWTRPRWAPVAWIVLGSVVAVVAVMLMVPNVPEYIAFEQASPLDEPVRGSWHWFPLGRGLEQNDMRGGPSWTPTFMLANGLGLIAIGAAVGITREPRSK
jgi:hypothetical protein